MAWMEPNATGLLQRCDLIEQVHQVNHQQAFCHLNFGVLV